jgi:hypothetical protein
VFGVTGRKPGGKADKAKALDKGLKTMFRTLEQRPTPDSIKTVVDQLDAAGAPPPKDKR